MFYPQGTRLGDIAEFDRSTKVEFTCEKCQIGGWRSKDPFVSHWFPSHGNEMADLSVCKHPTADLRTVDDYRPFPNRLTLAKFPVSTLELV